VDLKLKGKKAIVTGGTRGIGRAIAEELASEGADVAICARNKQQIDDAVKALGAKGVKAWGNPADVADTKALRAWVAAAAEALGGLDIFIANVSALAVATDEASWRKSFEIDVMGTVAGIEAALPLLEKSGAGAVVVIGSVAAVEVVGPTRPYNAVKAALVPYMKSVAQNYARKNVRVNMVSPGTIYFKGGVWNEREEKNPEMFKAAMARNPMGRMGKPEEVADAVVFLSSPRASFITGTNLIVDGAVTQRVQF
jgi:3-oxoacyl-[acyl-carrier protein] reductase